VVCPLIAWLSPSLGWFFVVMVFWGFTSGIVYTLGMAYTLEYGDDLQRPTYIGLANTLIAPVTIVAPFIGGWLADSAGYPSTFLVAAGAGLLTFLVLHFFVTDPRKTALNELKTQSNP
jgi:MFS family permease